MTSAFYFVMNCNRGVHPPHNLHSAVAFIYKVAIVHLELPIHRFVCRSSCILEVRYACIALVSRRATIGGSCSGSASRHLSWVRLRLPNRCCYADASPCYSRGKGRKSDRNGVKKW